MTSGPEKYIKRAKVLSRVAIILAVVSLAFTIVGAVANSVAQ